MPEVKKTTNDINYNYNYNYNFQSPNILLEKLAKKFENLNHFHFGISFPHKKIDENSILLWQSFLPIIEKNNAKTSIDTQSSFANVDKLINMIKKIKPKIYKLAIYLIGIINIKYLETIISYTNLEHLTLKQLSFININPDQAMISMIQFLKIFLHQCDDIDDNDNDNNNDAYDGINIISPHNKLLSLQIIEWIGLEDTCYDFSVINQFLDLKFLRRKNLAVITRFATQIDCGTVENINNFYTQFRCYCDKILSLIQSNVMVDIMFTIKHVRFKLLLKIWQHCFHPIFLIKIHS